MRRQGRIRGKYEGQSFQSTPLVRGIVVNTKDDIYNIGRIQVRIYNLHGTNEDGISDEELPWAKPCTLYSTHDGGSYLIPEIGTTVWLLFEDGDYSKPVYIGGSYGVGVTTDRVLGKTELSERIQPQMDSELPKQVKSENTHVLFKSPVGKSIIIDDSDENEEILFRDQLGQVISIQSKMKKDFKNGYTYKEEYTQDMRDNNFTDWDGLVDWCKMTIKSLSHSLFSIISNATSSIVNIKSKSKSSESNIELSSGDNKYVKLWVNGSDNNIIIDDSKIQVTVGGTSYTFTADGLSAGGNIFSSGSIIDTGGNTNHHSH